MDARDLLRNQFASVHQFLDGTMSDCSQETADYQGEGWNVGPISAIYAHIAITQDGIVHRLVQGRAPLLETEGWGERLGVDGAGPRDSGAWAGKRFDLATVRDFAAAVQAATDAFLAEVSDEVLERVMQTPMGEQRAIDVLANVGPSHVASHWGEIAALRGVQGEKGLQF